MFQTSDFSLSKIILIDYTLSSVFYGISSKKYHYSFIFNNFATLTFLQYNGKTDFELDELSFTQSEPGKL